MRIFVLNCGSSSVKAAVIDSETGQRLADARFEGIGETRALLRINGEERTSAACDAHEVAAARLYEALEPFLAAVTAVGHRVVHGGDKFVVPTLIDNDLESAIEALIPLAPLHNEACLKGIRAARKRFPLLPQVAVFDTAFHAALPIAARTYALPEEVTGPLGIRRFGFHGISHEYVARKAAEHAHLDLLHSRIIVCHLGNGSSLSAVRDGRSVETSMGMTPLEGLVMGTRSGDLDPGVVLYLQRAGNWSNDEVDALLNQKSGLLGLAGESSMREVEERADAGEPNAQLALDVFIHRLRKYIGAYVAVLGGVDLLAFTGGIGENSPAVRARAVCGLEFLGVKIDPAANDCARPGPENRVCDIAASDSRVSLLVVATDEEQSIAESVAALLCASKEPAAGDAAAATKQVTT